MAEFKIGKHGHKVLAKLLDSEREAIFEESPSVCNRSVLRKEIIRLYKIRATNPNASSKNKHEIHKFITSLEDSCSDERINLFEFVLSTSTIIVAATIEGTLIDYARLNAS